MNTILDSIIQGLIHDYTRTSLEKLGNWGIILIHVTLIVTLLLWLFWTSFQKNIYWHNRYFYGVSNWFIRFVLVPC